MNMSGQYSGLQARIKEINPLADYIPCSAHSYLRQLVPIQFYFIFCFLNRLIGITMIYVR